MNPTSFDIKDVLVAETSLDLEYKTNLFIAKEPTSPDDCVTIFDTGGFSPLLPLDRQSGDATNDRPSIQVRVRARDYITGYALIHNIKLKLHGYRGTVNGTAYVVVCISDPMHLDWDSNNRARFVVNFNIQRRT